MPLHMHTSHRAPARGGGPTYRMSPAQNSNHLLRVVVSSANYRQAKPKSLSATKLVGCTPVPRSRSCRVHGHASIISMVILIFIAHLLPATAQSSSKEANSGPATPTLKQNDSPPVNTLPSLSAAPRGELNESQSVQGDALRKFSSNWLAKADSGRRQRAQEPMRDNDDHDQESVILLAVDDEEEAGAGRANMQIEEGRALAAGTRELLELARTGRLDIRVARAQVLGGQPTRRTRRAGQQQQQSNKATGRHNRTSVVIRAFNYKLRLDLELNEVLFGPNLVQKHFIPKGTHISAHQLDNCYYHARSSPPSDADDPAPAQPAAIGAFRTCNGLSGIIHVNNESLVIHPFYSADLNKKQPHIIYRYQQTQKVAANLNRFTNQLGDNYSGGATTTTTIGECGNLRAPNELRQSPRSALNSALDDRFKRDNYNGKRPNVTWTPAPQQQQQQVAGMLKHLLSKRDVGLTEKYIELGLVLSKDMFTKRNASSRLEVLHDAIQIINCLDLYFRRSTNTRVGLVYIETWAHGDQIETSDDPKFTLYNFLDYTTRHMYGTHKDAVHLITGGHEHQFQANSFGMSIPDSVCEPKAVSVSQESSVLEPFITAATIAHLIGHNLGMDHDGEPESAAVAPPSESGGMPPPQTSATTTATTTTTLDDTAAATATAAARVGVAPQSARAKGGAPLLMSAPRHRANQRQHQDQHHPSLSASSDGLTADDHEDEIKSRSLTYEPRGVELSAVGTGSGDQLTAASTAVMQDTAANCQVNCIMSERFVFQHPPIALGNMVQHTVIGKQAATGGQAVQAAQDQVNTYSIQETSVLGAGEQADDEGGEQTPSSLSASSSADQLHDASETTISNVAAASLPFRFSQRSIDTYYSMLRDGGGACLWNKPNKLESSIVATCGNGIVERDEDCDCGTRADCWTDTCCERLTCKFRKDVECISGACCDRCRFRPRGFMCRRSRGECDLAEYCDGASGACSPDVHKQNGFPCTGAATSTGSGGGGGGGYCYMGQCPTHDGQCSELWGAHSRISDKLCYAQLNTNGTIFGNCGRPEAPPTASGHGAGPLRGGAKLHPTTANYKRCEQADQMCGTLQCQLGDMKPITADLPEAGGGGGGGGRHSSTRYEFSRKVLRHSAGDLECKMITRPIGAGPGTGAGGRGSLSAQAGGPGAASSLASSISYVRDGSKCADGRVCFNQTCVALERAYPEAFELCPRDEQGHFCAQHGVCSTANRCHCDAGWTGEDCSQAADVQMQQAQQQQQQQRRPTTTLIEINTQQQQHMGAMSQQQQQPPPATLDEFQSVSNTQRPFNGSGGAQQPLATTTLASVQETTPTTTTPDTSQDVQPPQPTQAPVSTTTTVQDKKKNESLGAQTLVLILVSIVAAVYLGFALMANCYRRKGLLKPDKVLRHHQMNCKMDALRSSFIAKRLADAETLNFDGPLAASNGPHGGIGGGGGTGPGSGAGHQWAPLLSHNASGTSADLMSPFVSPIPAINLQHQFVPPPQQPPVQEFSHQPPPPPPPVVLPGQHNNLNDDLSSSRIHMTASSILNPPTRLGAKQAPPQQVRYFDPSEQMMVGAVGSGDHIPLLGGASAGSDPHRMLHQPMMRSFNQVQQTLADRRRAQQSRRPLYQVRTTTGQAMAPPPPPQQSTWTMRSSDLKDDNSRAGPTRAANHHHHHLGTFMNRTTSLGSVHRHQQQRHEHEREREPTEDEDASLLDEMVDQERRLAAQGALATPSRSLRDKRAAARARASSIGYQHHHQGAHHSHERSRELLGARPSVGADFDSCSAPSSPEHRARRESAAYWTSGGTEGELVRPSRPRNSQLKQQRSFERQVSPAPDSAASPPPPPPPPLVTPHNGLDPVTASTSHDEYTVGAAAAEHEHHLSLIGQLQQLERVQSLHAKQVAAATNNTGGLHEFFSLPLSVQLSALLARSLAAESGQLSPVTTHIDEFLNTLNNTNVAASSRRVLKAVGSAATGVSKQSGFELAQSGSSSRGGTMRKQQQQQQQSVKLQNLSSLIGRLQKLQHKTMIQQQQEQDLDGDDDYYESNGEIDLNEDELPVAQHNQQRGGGQQSRHSTLGRASRSGSRATNQIAAEVHRGHGQVATARPPNVRRGDSRRTRDDSGEQAAAASKNDLVYSMSDSEDGGAYETRRHSMLARPKRGVASARTRQTGGGAMPSRTPSMEAHEECAPTTPEPRPRDPTGRSSPLADNSSAAPSLTTDDAVSSPALVAAQNSQASPGQPRTPSAKEN